MALKTCDAALKAEFAKAGCSLTPAQEHIVATATTIDWKALLAALGNIASTLIPLIIAIFGGQTPPAPAPANAKQGATCPCDDRDCCKKTFDAAIHTAKLAGDHLAACCCEYC